MRRPPGPRRGGIKPMIKTLQCPSCGAPLEYDPSSGSDTIRCHFCQSTAMLPGRARHEPQERVSFGRPRLKLKGSPAAAIVILSVVLLAGGAVVVAIALG